jgi:hypothetical protein
MEIKTKFDLGDEAFVLYSDRVHKVVITGIETFTNRSGETVTNYNVRFAAGGETKMSENRLFETKLELFNSL